MLNFFSLSSLLCRCSEKARSFGYRYIGIQFYAECWAGNCEDYDSGGASSNCLQSFETKRHDNEVCNFDIPTDCAGKGHDTNFVYDMARNSNNRARDASAELSIVLNWTCVKITEKCIGDHKNHGNKNCLVVFFKGAKIK